MEEETAEAGVAGGAVEGVADYRVADAREMHADLMRAAGSDLHFEKSVAGEAIEGAILGPGGAAFRQAGGHADAAHGIARDGALDAAGLLLHRAVDQSEVYLLDLAA